MKPKDGNNQAREQKLSEQFVDFIDLTDEDLEEIHVPEFGRIQGGSSRNCWGWGGSCGGWGWGGSCSCGGWGWGGSCSCGGWGGDGGW